MASRLRMRFLSAVVMALVAIGVSSCTQIEAKDVEMKNDLQSAKSEALKTSSAILAFIPEENVGEKFEQTVSSTLFECSGGGYSWPARASTHLQGDFDSSRFVDSVIKEWSSKDGWVVEKSPANVHGMPRLDIKGPGGAEYIVRLASEGQEVQVSIWSACFEHDGPKPGETY